MQTRNRNTFTTIHTEGALLPVDLLQRITENDSSLEGLKPVDYHLAPGEKLNEAINRSWNRLSGLWGTFSTAREKFSGIEPGTTLTRERWLLPLFQELEFGRVSTAKAQEIEGKTYPISHNWQKIPLHLVGCGLDLDKRTPGAAGAARISPHSLLQEFLNRSEDAQWGMLSNGLTLRILRDNVTLTRQAYVEFDLESMFDGEVYSDFVLLWLVCHQSRFEISDKDTECLLERWSKNAQEQGTRALDDLRNGVETAITTLGQGFLQHPQNAELKLRLKNGDLSAQDYYRQLLRLVYRLIFLFAAEDRNLLLLPNAPEEAVQRYQDFYSTSVLRTLAQRQRGSRHHDRYEILRLVMTLLGSDTGCPELAIPALGGFLFDESSTSDLNEAKISNQSLLEAVRSLAFITEGNTRRAVDYRNMGSEELGSIYESLLELHPLLNIDAGTFSLTSAAGNERKKTGSYYTPTSLIKVLLDSALDPVIGNALKRTSQQVGHTGRNQQQLASIQEQALLDLNVCDPACGSGHFLIAAAHRIAGKLAQVRSGGDEPAPIETRRALRDVIRHCIYGVDINPMAVELCKVNLWLESLEPGKPLSFLDAHIKCGNSLVGVGPKMDLDTLEIPDDAFKPVTGDHKPSATLLRKRNKQESEGQESLFVTVLNTQEDLDDWLAQRAQAIEDMPEDDAVQVQAKAKAFEEINQSDRYLKQRQIADLWTSAFFWKIDEPGKDDLSILAPTHGQLQRLRYGLNVQEGLLNTVNELSKNLEFFHWPIEFADVQTRDGFDCVLGNPPWERVRFDEKEFFAYYDPSIIVAQNKNDRQKLIEKLFKSNPKLEKLLITAKHSVDCENKFFRNSDRYFYSSSGDINTYSLFAELNRDSINESGYSGFITPSSLLTVDSAKYFFKDLLQKNQITNIIDFDNTRNLFTDVDSNFKFCIVTLIGNQSIDENKSKISCVFGLSDPIQQNEIIRKISLNIRDFALFNPNTHTSPIIRTRIDYEILRKIYTRIPVLISDLEERNDWGVVFQLMFMMNTDSHLFRERKFFDDNSFSSQGNKYKKGDDAWLPLYEGKMMHQFDHRFAHASSPKKGQHIRGTSVEITNEEHKNPDYVAFPRYWVSEKETERRFKYKRNWIIGFRDVAGTVTNIRTLVFTLLAKVALGNKVPVIYLNNANKLSMVLCFIGNSNSLILDYVVRQKTSGMSLNFYIIKQLPFLPQNEYGHNDILFLAPRILELIHTAWDIQPFADDLWIDSAPELRFSFQRQWEENVKVTDGGNNKKKKPTWSETTSNPFPFPPFQWDENRRTNIIAEIDAYFAALYGLTRDELRYILDPQDVYGPDFPGETFRVLKDKEIRQYGEYRTRRLVLEAWDRLEASGELPVGREMTNEPEPENIQPASAIRLDSKKVSTPSKEPKASASKPKLQPGPAPLLDFAAVNPQVEEPPEPVAPVTSQVEYGLYKCGSCGAMVMSYDLRNHEAEKHVGKSVEWKKIG